MELRQGTSSLSVQNTGPPFFWLNKCLRLHGNCSWRIAETHPCSGLYLSSGSLIVAFHRQREPCQAKAG